MTVQHKNLTASQVHEPKGVSTASLNEFNLASSNVNDWSTLHYNESQTAAADTELDFTGLADCREIHLCLDDLVPSTTGFFYLRFSEDNGSSFNSTDIYHSSWFTNNAADSASLHNAISLNITTSVRYRTGKIIISNFNKALVSTYRGFIHRNSSADLGGTSGGENVIGAVDSATAWNSLRIWPSSGTFTGVVTLEGIKG